MSFSMMGSDKRHFNFPQQRSEASKLRRALGQREFLLKQQQDVITRHIKVFEEQRREMEAASRTLWGRTKRFFGKMRDGFRSWTSGK